MAELKIKKSQLVFNSYGELDMQKSKLPWISYDDKKNIKIDTVLLTKYISKGIFEETSEHLIEYLQVLGKKINMSDFYVYNKKQGVWECINPELFKGYIFKFIPAEVRKNQIKSEVWSEIIENTDKERICTFDTFNVNIDDYINFQDGMLNLKTKELLPHDPKFKSTIQIPCKYKDILESKGYAPTFNKYMDDLCKDKPDYKTLLLEFCGAVISNIPGEKFKKALIMKGLGDTGKSKLRSLVEYLIGENNSVPIQFSQLNEKYAVDRLYGKRLAGHGELADEVATNLKVFKALTGGDQVSSDRKYQDNIDFVFHGLFWYNSNFFIKFGGDRGKWVYDRMIIMEFNNVIPVEKRDKNLLDKMKKEKAGILFQMLQALYQLIENNLEFHLNSDLKDLLDQCMIENSTALQFIKACCVQTDKMSKSKTLRSALYSYYIEWCSYNKYLQKSKQNFFRELEDALSDKDGNFFCNIHGTYYVRKYRFDKELYDKEVNKTGVTNVFLSDDEVFESQFGEEELKKRKIIDIEKAKVEQQQKITDNINKINNTNINNEQMWF